MGALYEQRWLIAYFVQRQLSGIHRGSFLGFAWLILGPMLMVVLYTLVFSKIIGLRFRETQSVSNFGLYLYCGLLPFQAFSDTLNRAVTSIRGNPLVERVVFPLEILPLSTALTAFAAQFLGFGALMILVVLLEQELHWTLLLLPIVAIPQLLFVLGMSYLVSIAGTYLPDVRESLRALLRAMLFVTPILWPASLVPERFRFVVDYNPLAFLVEAYRNLILEGKLPDMTTLLLFTLLSATLAVAGLALFMRLKKHLVELV